MPGKKAVRSLERIDIRGVGYETKGPGILGVGSFWIVLEIFLDMEGGKGIFCMCMGGSMYLF